MNEVNSSEKNASGKDRFRPCIFETPQWIQETVLAKQLKTSSWSSGVRSELYEEVRQLAWSRQSYWFICCLFHLAVSKPRYLFQWRCQKEVSFSTSLSLLLPTLTLSSTISHPNSLSPHFPFWVSPSFPPHPGQLLSPLLSFSLFFYLLEINVKLVSSAFLC